MRTTIRPYSAELDDATACTPGVPCGSVPGGMRRGDAAVSGPWSSFVSDASGAAPGQRHVGRCSRQVPVPRPDQRLWGQPC